MISRQSRWLAALGLSLCALMASCAGRAGPLPSGQHGGNAPAAQPLAAPGTALLNLPAPSTLLGLLHKTLPEPPKRTSYVEADLVQAGAAFVPALPRQREAAVAGGGQLSPSWVSGSASGFADLAFCTYAFHVPFYDRNPQLRLTWTTPPADFHQCWIGLSRWIPNRWDWFQGTADGKINLASMSPYFNPSADMLVVVLRIGTDVSTLAQIRLGGLAPTADITPSPGEGPTPLHVDLDASFSTPGEGSITKYEWDLDDDGTFEIDGGTTTFSSIDLNTNGEYPLAVRVTNSLGIKAAASVMVYAAGEWQHTWGLSINDEILSIAADGRGMIYGVGYVTRPVVGSDLLITQWTPAGRVVWAKTWESGVDERGTGIAVDGDGNLVVCGSLGSGTGGQAFAQKWDNQGALLWSVSIGGTDYDAAEALAVDGVDIYVGGETINGIANLDYFACSLDATGGLSWSRYRDSGDSDDLLTDLEFMQTAPPGVSGLILCGAPTPGTGAGLWRVEYALDGAFIRGATMGSPGMPVQGGRVIGTYNTVTLESRYYTAGLADNGSGYQLFVSCTDGSGAQVYATRWWNVDPPTIQDLTFDGQGGLLVSGYMKGFDVGSYYAMLWKFDAPTGIFDSCAYWNNGAVMARAPAMELSLGGLLLGGAAKNASGSWNALIGSNASFSVSYSAADGSGGDAAWIGLDDPGSVNDATFSGTLDTGGGLTDALLVRRALP
jgi:hypothetical protein